MWWARCDAHRSAKPRSTGLVGAERGAGGVSIGINAGSLSQVLLRAVHVLGALIDLEEVIIEEEYPDVPVGHQVELLA